ncbi:MAG: hypothetical protein BRC44_17640 [Cyanobacteria bacterium QS_4_48_99]|nr:MAG: hypothetical protein BRC44_17640 [Cyanobacteria bacterium QS_4_48_99]PSO86301.1 MAG: hypothetical protein BRC43_11540 [Cyanobacteria bacterium QS_3_48_167]
MDKAVTKNSGQTNQIKRFNNTLRQRVGRLVIKSFSFSKSLEKYLEQFGSLCNHYNGSLQT